MGNLRIAAARPGSTSRSGGAAPARFAPKGQLQTRVKEASDVVALGAGRFAVVSDTRAALFVVDSRGRSLKLELEGIKGESELEGVAYDPVKQRLFVSREERGELLRYTWKGGADRPVLEKKLDAGVDGSDNKGIEGLAYLPAGQSPTSQAQLLGVKEGRPRQLLAFADSGKGEPVEVDLDKELKRRLDDFSALAVDPKTGHVFIASDESSAVAQVRLVRDGKRLKGVLVQSLELHDGAGGRLERIEGLTFDPKGDLFVLTENDGVLHRLERR